MHEGALLVLGLIVLGYGLVSGRLARTAVTGPMVFVAFGLLVGPHALGVLELELGGAAGHLLATITLAVVLFTDAARIDLRALRRELGIPVRLLAIGLPATILLGGALAALLFPGLSLFEAAVLGAILAPTDAALGQAVIASERVPLRIRQALNVESGLNDGIALPVVVVLAALASGGDEALRSTTSWLVWAGLQVTVGPAVGIAIGWLGGQIVRVSRERGWLSAPFQRLSGLALALIAFTGSEALGGNGFIAAFAAGLTLGATARDFCACLYDFLEAEGQLLVLVVFLALGADLAWPALMRVDGAVVLYALGSLTVVRMLPVALSLVGARLQPASHAFLGWFGPRGLATVLFGLLVLDEMTGPGREQIFAIAIVTVLASIVAHGATAVPGVRWYARRLADKRLHEHGVVTNHPLRHRA